MKVEISGKEFGGSCHGKACLCLCRLRGGLVLGEVFRLLLAFDDTFRLRPSTLLARVGTETRDIERMQLKLHYVAERQY
jgi:hypothetical protein